MQIQMHFILILLAALATGGGSQIATTSNRKIHWGYGCGGHCAVNTSGESETILDNDPPHIHLEDQGTLTQRMSDPSGIMITTTQWKYKFHGTSTAGADRREFDLHTDKSECKRTRETTGSGNRVTKKRSACAVPPKRWKLICERKDVPVKGELRPAWVCSPIEAFDNFGTEFPWVFGVDESITTVVSGEPQATTTYEATPPSGRHD